jgi:hypothetical protein
VAIRTAIAAQEKIILYVLGEIFLKIFFITSRNSLNDYRLKFSKDVPHVTLKATVKIANGLLKINEKRVNQKITCPGL